MREIKERVNYNKSLLDALTTPFLQLKSVMSTDNVSVARIPMSNMEGIESVSSQPVVVYNRQNHRELAMCALNTDAVAKDLQVMLVGTPHGPAHRNHEALDAEVYAEQDFTKEDLDFLGKVSSILTLGLENVAYYEALRTVMEQACLLLERRVAAGAGWGLLVEDNDTLLWLCCTDRARRRLHKMRVKRETHSTLFKALDTQDSVHLADVWFDEVCAPGPGRCGGGLTRGDVLMMPIIVEGRVAAIIGLDLYGAADKLTTTESNKDPKCCFTPANRAIAEELTQKTGPCVTLLRAPNGTNDWSIAYLDIVMKLARQELVDLREAGVAEVEAALAVPRKHTLVIIDALFKILDYRKPELETLSWTGKRDIFLSTNMWNRMIRFHPDRWRGDYRKLEQVAFGLYNMGPDQVLECVSPAFQCVYAWLDIVVVVISQRQKLSGAFEVYRLQQNDEVGDSCMGSLVELAVTDVVDNC